MRNGYFFFKSIDKGTYSFNNKKSIPQQQKNEKQAKICSTIFLERRHFMAKRKIPSCKTVNKEQLFLKKALIFIV